MKTVGNCKREEIAKNKSRGILILDNSYIFAKAKIGGASEIKPSKFSLYFSRLALSLFHK
jgi:hypothetical protein